MSTSLKVEQKFSTGGLGQITFAIRGTKAGIKTSLKIISTDCKFSQSKNINIFKTKLVNIFLKTCVWKQETWQRCDCEAEEVLPIMLAYW